MLLTKPGAGINAYLGFRVCREDASESTKKRAHRLAGIYWAAAGGILAVATLLVLLFTIGADALGMLTAVAVCLLVQLVAILVILFLLKAAIK